MHTDTEMLSCRRSGAQCVLYVGVYGQSSSTLRCAYTIVASIDVVDSGFSVSSPARLAGDYVFSLATFGPALPTVGTPTPVVPFSPADGCDSSSTAAVGGNSLAMVVRGGCTFAEKTIHAQAAGHVGLIIVNSEADGVVRMGAGAHTGSNVTHDAPLPPVVCLHLSLLGHLHVSFCRWAQFSLTWRHVSFADPAQASRFHIPAVMITHETGNELRAAIDAGDTVNVTLHQPRNRPMTLVHGRPQQLRLLANEMRWFAFTVGNSSEVSLSLTRSPMRCSNHRLVAVGS